MHGLMPLFLALVCGAAFFGFVNHLVAGLQKPVDKVQLYFAGFCLSCAILCALLVYEYQIFSIDKFILLIKVQAFAAAFYYIVQVLFVEAYTGVRYKPVSFLIMSLSLAFAIAGLFRPEGLFLDSHAGVSEPVESLWGRHIEFKDPQYSLAGGCFMLFTLSQYFYFVWCCFSAYKRDKNKTLKYLMVCVTAYYVCLIIDIYFRLTHGLTVYFSAVIFLAYLVYMSNQMSSQSRTDFLEKSERKYRHLLEGVVNDYVIFSCDNTGRMVYVSPSSKAILGYSPKEILSWGDDSYQAVFGSMFQSIQGSFQNIVETGEGCFESPFFKNDKNEIRLEIHCKPVYENNCLVAVEGYAKDITLLKSNQQALEKLNEDLENRVSDRAAILEATLFELREEIEAKEQLENQLIQSQKIESIGQLAGGVAHDFNNIMTAIKGFAEISINELRKGHDITDDLEQILTVSDKGVDLTNQLLGFARKQMAVPKVIKPNEIISNTVQLLPRLLETSILVHFDFEQYAEESLWPIKIDPVQLDQIVINLAVNARDAMLPHGGDVFIEMRNVTSLEMSKRFDVTLEGQDYFCLSMRDTGKGMSEEVSKKIFDPFFTTKPIGKGSGLGLAVCYGVVKQYSGYIFSESIEGQGSTFFILLPKSEGSVQQVDKPVENSDIAIQGGSETILLVEDDGAVAMLTERVLKTVGYSVLVAEDGLKALDLAEQYSGEIDLMITDIMMPKMDGQELIAAIRLLSPAMGIICLSGYADDDIIADVVSKGATFVKKPYTPIELAKIVRSVLDETLKRKVLNQSETGSFA